MAFYNAMGGPDWLQRDFWGSDRPVGVVARRHHRRRRLRRRQAIYDNNVTGRCRRCAACSGCRRSISFNNIYGQLPDGAGR